MGSKITIRGISKEVAERLRRLSRERGLSVNGTVLEILSQAAGRSERSERLARYATWTQEEFERVMACVAAQRVIDDSPFV